MGKKYFHMSREVFVIGLTLTGGGDEFLENFTLMSVLEPLTRTYWIILCPDPVRDSIF